MESLGKSMLRKREYPGSHMWTTSEFLSPSHFVNCCLSFLRCHCRCNFNIATKYITNFYELLRIPNKLLNSRILTNFKTEIHESSNCRSTKYVIPRRPSLERVERSCTILSKQEVLHISRQVAVSGRGHTTAETPAANRPQVGGLSGKCEQMQVT